VHSRAAVLIGAVLGAAATVALVRPDLGAKTSRPRRDQPYSRPVGTAAFRYRLSGGMKSSRGFTGRLPESPQIVDLGGDGFSLLGGRVDVLGEQPVATVIYATVAIPIKPHDAPRPARGLGRSIAGYTVRTWREGEFTYVAVADLPDVDLRPVQARVFGGLIALERNNSRGRNGKTRFPLA